MCSLGREFEGFQISYGVFKMPEMHHPLFWFLLIYLKKFFFILGSYTEDDTYVNLTYVKAWITVS